MVSLTRSRLLAVARSHPSWLDDRHEIVGYWVFAAYAVAVIILASGQDAIWPK